MTSLLPDLIAASIWYRKESRSFFTSSSRWRFFFFIFKKVKGNEEISLLSRDLKIGSGEYVIWFEAIWKHCLEFSFTISVIPMKEIYFVEDSLDEMEESVG